MNEGILVCPGLGAKRSEENTSNFSKLDSSPNQSRTLQTLRDPSTINRSFVVQQIGMPPLSRLSAGLQYRSAMRGQMIGTRMFTATRVSYTKHGLLSSSYSHNLVIEMDREEDGHKTYEPDIKRASKENVSWGRFYQLEKVSMSSITRTWETVNKL